MRREPILFAVLIAVCMSAVCADTLILKDGRKFKGKIIKRTAENVTIRTDLGADMGFKMGQVATIEITTPTPKANAAAPRAGSAPVQISSDLRAEVQKLRQDVDDLKKDNERLMKQLAGLKEMKEKIDSLSDTLTDVDKRASRLPPKRGDFKDSPDRSRFTLSNCTIERGGDEFKVHGFVRNVGSSPGTWTRVIAELQDGNGKLITKNDVLPTFTSSGSHETRNRSVLAPGESYEFYSYIPYGRWASSKGEEIGIADDVLPPSGKDPKNIADTVTLTPPGRRFSGMQLVLKLEIPPKDRPQGKGAK
ncbi:MAG: hypothetical protein GXP25_22575 [Planctomycetes bacterium]|nr:hypothetical protein [Planctomycetota bacterium]